MILFCVYSTVLYNICTSSCITESTIFRRLGRSLLIAYEAKEIFHGAGKFCNNGCNWFCCRGVPGVDWDLDDPDVGVLFYNTYDPNVPQSAGEFNCF